VEDETPAWVAIPAGNCTIKSRSDLYPLLTMLEVIEAGRSTEIHLDSGWKPPLDTATNQIVYLPNSGAAGRGSSSEN